MPLRGSYHVLYQSYDDGPDFWNPGGSAWGIAPGEDIGLRDWQVDLPVLPVGQGVGLGGLIGGVVAASAGLPSVLGPAPGPGLGRGYVPPPPGGPIPEAEREKPWYQYERQPGDPDYGWGDPLPDDEEQSPDPDRPPGPVVIPPTAGEEVEDEDTMPAFVDFASDVIDLIQGQAPGGQTNLVAPAPLPRTNPVVPGTPAPTTGNTNMRWNPKTGRWECRRRRRRRLLTDSDFNDLMRIATLPNKQNVTVALAKAIGRRS